MTQQGKRCYHCKTTYTYQGSGDGCFRKENDSKFCPDCMKAINETLDKIPKKFKEAWIETTEVTFEQLKQWEKDKVAEYEAKRAKGEMLFPMVKRVFVGSVNMKIGERDVIEHVNGRDSFRNREFIYKYWSSTPDQITITTRVEKNIKTGETTPWKDYR